MSTLVIPNVFVNGTTINAAPFNQNFGNIVTWSTTIDNTNIGAAGLFPSQLLPLTGAQATFGATATGVGYKFLANDTTAVPLTASGVSGQTADLFDVTLTSGATKAFFVNSAGNAFSSGALSAYLTAFSSPSGVSAGDGVLQRSSSSGKLWLGGSSAGTLDYGVTNAGQFAFTNGQVNIANSGLAAGGNIVTVNGYIVASVSSFSAPASVTSGDLVAQISATSGTLHLGGASSSMLINWNSTVSNQLALYSLTNSAYTAFTAGAYTNGSDERYKGNIEDLPHGLDVLRALQPRQFTLNHEDSGLRHFGFIAQHVRSVVPELVGEDSEGFLGIRQPHLLAIVAKAVQQLDAKFEAYAAARA